MPRKSAAALSIVKQLPGAKRPDPPKELTAEEAVEWRAVVGRLPPDWFPRESHALLVAYCRHVVRARVIAAEISSFDTERLKAGDGLRRFDRLTQIGEREGRAISSLATRMRLTQQSRYQPQRAASQTSASKSPVKPWEFVA